MYTASVRWRKLPCMLALTYCALVRAAPDPSLGGFDINESYRMLAYSQSAYCASPAVQAWDCVPCHAPIFSGKVQVTQYLNYTVPRSDSNYSVNHVFGYVGSYTDGDFSEIVVAFQGSADMQEWLNDFKIWRIVPDLPDAAAKGVEVHSGFYNCTSAVWSELQGAVVSLLQHPPNGVTYNQISVTGHSLGAALAVVAGVRLRYDTSVDNDIDIVSYTYGQPRVGNEAFSKLYEGSGIKHFRVVHWDDPVPHVPPSLFGFYAQTWPEIFQQDVYVNAQESLTYCASEEQNDKCSGTLGFLLLESVLDNLMTDLDVPAEDIQALINDYKEATFLMNQHLHYFNLPLGSAACGGDKYARSDDFDDPTAGDTDSLPSTYKPCAQRTTCSACTTDSSDGPTPSPPPSPRTTCEPMTTINKTQILCAYEGVLDRNVDADVDIATEFALLFSNIMGKTLKTTCQWAVFLGQVGDESKCLTEFAEIGKDGKWKGRGPLQLSSEINYNACAKYFHEVDPTIPDITADPDIVATNHTIGVMAAYWIWAKAFSGGLDQYVTDNSFLGLWATTCWINAGKYVPDDYHKGYCRQVKKTPVYPYMGTRKRYWNQAKTCLGLALSEADQGFHDKYNDDAVVPFYDQCVWCAASQECRPRFDTYSNDCWENAWYDNELSIAVIDLCCDGQTDVPADQATKVVLPDQDILATPDCAWYSNTHSDTELPSDPAQWYGGDFLPPTYIGSAECMCRGGTIPEKPNLLWMSSDAQCVVATVLLGHQELDAGTKQQLRASRGLVNSALSNIMHTIYTEAYGQCKCPGTITSDVNAFASPFLTNGTLCHDLLRSYLLSSRCGCNF